MRWRGRRESSNIEDQRGEGGAGGGFRFPFPRRGGPGAGQGRMRMPVGRKGGIGLTGMLVMLGLFLLFGGDLGSILGGLTGGGTPGQSPMPRIPGLPGTGNQSMPKIPGLPRTGSPSSKAIPKAGDDLKKFVAVVLADTEDTWNKLFKDMGRNYREPKLVLFTNSVRSACGFAKAAMGPFYCPLDKKVYIDLTFFRDMGRKLGAPGDFAQAYVVAHEIGHHVQNELGIMGKVQSFRQRASKTKGNAITVRLELQADCFAGVWAHHTEKAKSVLERGDIEEGIGAASAVGDDRLQRRAQGYVVPESFTHGSSKQRVKWFKKGLNTGDLVACDTFNIGWR